MCNLMKSMEYTTLVIAHNPALMTNRYAEQKKVKRKLSVLGLEGWELVGMTKILEEASEQLIMVLKREVELLGYD